MSSPITNKQLNQLSDVIREWPIEEKITWDTICVAAEFILGYIPTRQALASKQIIVNAYKTRKAEIKSKYDALASISTPKSMPAAVEQIIKLKKEKESLKAELQLMAETAQRFIHNASLHGLTREQLMQPLSKLTRSN